MLNFPDAPTVNQIFTSGAISWKWDGTKWVVSGNAVATVITMNTGGTITTGFTGFVRVENTTSAPMTVTLPATPTAGQTLTVKDMSGNAGTYPITVAGGAATIEGAASIVIRSNWGWVSLIHTGVQWGQA